MTTPAPAGRLYALKAGASLDGLQPSMLSALDVAAALWQEFGEELIVTSGTDGAHGTGSLHAQGLATDLRTRQLSHRQIKARADELLRRLGAGYDVIVEQDHLHVEYDGKTHVAVNFHPPSLASAFA